MLHCGIITQTAHNQKRPKNMSKKRDQRNEWLTEQSRDLAAPKEEGKRVFVSAVRLGCGSELLLPVPHYHSTLPQFHFLSSEDITYSSMELSSSYTARVVS